MKLTLYTIHDELQQLFDAMEACPPEEVEALGAKLQDMQLAWDEKLGGCCAYLKNLEAEITAYETELKRLTQTKKGLAAQYDRFKSYLAKFAPKTKWKNGPHAISWRMATRVEVEDERLIPAAYKREVWKLEPDKAEIKAAIESGASVPGAKLLEEEHIQVK